MHRSVALALALLFAPVASAQGVLVKGGDSSDRVTVDANKNVRGAIGASARPTYIASAGALSCNAANGIAIDAGAYSGFKLLSWCANVSVATTGAGINVFVRSHKTAATGGTALVADGTATASISKMDPADPAYPGAARGGSVSGGTAVATLDQVGFNTGEVGTGNETQPTYTFCREYAKAGEKAPTIPAGINNGLIISLSATGVGALSTCAVTATIVVE